MPETITNPYMNFTADFYRRDVAMGTQAILRRRCLQAELARARQRLREEEEKGSEARGRRSASS